MRGISEEELKDMLREESRLDIKIALNYLIQQCKELNPWLPIDEFLKYPKYGWCWVTLKNKQVHISCVGYNDIENYVFYCDDSRDEEYNINDIAAVMHIPEPTHYQELPDDPKE